MLINDANLSQVAKGFKTIVNEHFDAVESFKDTLAMTTTSQGAEEEYGWFGQFPGLREWVGDRQIKKLSSHGFTIKNRKFESTIRVARENIEDDKIGVYRPQLMEMGRTSKMHPDKLLFELLAAGWTTTCYDGQNFFDTEHPSPVAGSEMAMEGVSNSGGGSGAPWFLLDLSRAIKPLIWQERMGYQFQSLTSDTSAHVFLRDEYLYGIRARVNAGVGLWQLAYGSKAQLDDTNYAAAREAMMKYVGDRGDRLGIMPTHLVVGPSNEKEARALLLADQASGTSNVWKGTAQLIVTPLLD